LWRSNDGLITAWVMAACLFDWYFSSDTEIPISEEHVAQGLAQSARS
jgi:hypothetical protein